jgi:subtilisin family serine protease
LRQLPPPGEKESWVFPSRKGRVGVTVLALTTAAATALSTGSAASAAEPAPAHKAPVSTKKITVPTPSKVHGVDRSAHGPQTVFVELSGTSSADLARADIDKKASPGERDKVKARRAAVARQGSAVLATAKDQDAKATKLFTVSNSVPGVAIRTDADGIDAVAARSDVVKVSRIIPKHLTNANTSVLTRAYDTWKYAGDLGRGVRIGVIDTGIDYTHADFGGTGTPQAYAAAKAASTSPTWRDSLPALGKAKIAGGHDFVGDDYDASPRTDTGAPNPDYQPVPHPDENPLDCNEHGTHVSGTAAGYGVNANGSTFTGDYPSLTQASLLDMKVGPGMAPGASLYGLKVFGCEGSTDAVIPALDWAMDPNGDGDFSDHLDIVNLSLGSDESPADDPENDVVNELTSHGVLAVMSAGNNGDLTDTGGSPGNAVSSLTVASSVDSYQLRDGLKVNAPSDVAGITAGQMSVAYDWPNNGPTHQPVTGTVATIPGDNADGCQPLSATDAAKVAGKVAWLEWDDNDSTRRCGSAGRAANVRNAGAVGAIFTSGLDVFAAGITGDATIPVIQLPKAGTDKLRPSAEAGTLQVTFDGALRGTIKDITDAISDTLSSFSSRGDHGSLGVVKPDVAAPGDTIASAGMGTGSDVLVLNGTSMASPLTAGISALVRAKHPDYSPLMLKAAVMNNATHDVWTGPNKSGNRYAPARVGAGRVDAFSAVNADSIAYSPGQDNPVSASFGVVPARVDRGTISRSLPLTVHNESGRSTRYHLSYDPVVSQPGVSYSVSPRTLTVKGHGTGKAKVTMRVQPKALRHTIDPTMARTQLDLARQYVSDASGRVLVTPAGENALRVPVYGAAKPVSTTDARANGQRIVLSGKGFQQGGGSTGWTSLASVLQLGAKSGTLPVCLPNQSDGCATTQSDRAGDLRYVGAGSSGDWLWFGISSYADWAKVGTALIPFVDYDTTGDGKPDYETFAQMASASDVLLAFTVDYHTGETVDIQPINFNLGDVDTNVFDTNVLMLPVLKEAVGIGTTSKPITYTVGTANGYGGTTDTVGPVTFDAGTPTLTTDGPLYLDQGGTRIDYETSGRAPVKALVLHLHGASGKRAQVLALPRSGHPSPRR